MLMKCHSVHALLKTHVYLEQRSAHYHNAAFVTLCLARNFVSSHCRFWVFPHRSLPLFCRHISSLISSLQFTVKVFFNKMIGQKTINSFFSPVSKKRISNESEEDVRDSVSVTSASNTVIQQQTTLACNDRPQRYSCSNYLLCNCCSILNHLVDSRATFSASRAAFAAASVRQCCSQCCSQLPP